MALWLAVCCGVVGMIVASQGEAILRLTGQDAEVSRQAGRFLDIIELPSSYPAFGRLKDFTLEPGMVINFEFLYFGHSVTPYHLESSYLIGEHGAECLHTMPHQLFELE